MPTLILFAIADESPRIVEAEALGLTETLPGPLDPTEQRQAWHSLSRTPPTTVWVEWGNLTPPDLPSLRRFRVSAPQTRIIIEVPESLSPPNEALAQLVGLHITDIVRSPSTPMADVLAHPGTYADVASWQGTVHTFDEPDPEPKERVVEKIVEREVVRETIKKVATTSRPVLITVWGFSPGTGATTLAVAIAAFLSRIAPTAVVDHAPQMNAHGHPRPGQTGLHAWEQTQPPIRGLTWVTAAITPDGAVILPSAREVLKSHEFAYVVVDAGLDPPTNDPDGRDLWEDSDLTVLCIPPAFTRWQGIWPWLDRATQIKKQYTAVIFGESSPVDLEDPELACLAIPWLGSPAHEPALIGLLAAVLPDDLRPRKRRGLWRKPRAPKPQVPRPEPDQPESISAPPAIPRTHRAPRPFRVGHRAVWALQSAWDLLLLAVVLGIIGLFVWLLGLLEVHLPGFARSTLGQWIHVISRWEGHWFAKVPAPPKGAVK